MGTKHLVHSEVSPFPRLHATCSKQDRWVLLLLLLLLQPLLLLLLLLLLLQALLLLLLLLLLLQASRIHGLQHGDSSLMPALRPQAATTASTAAHIPQSAALRPRHRPPWGSAGSSATAAWSPQQQRRCICREGVGAAEK